MPLLGFVIPEREQRGRSRRDLPGRRDARGRRIADFENLPGDGNFPGQAAEAVGVRGHHH
jgi:hypothetical protein